jgi:hypothetical protein
VWHALAGRGEGPLGAAGTPGAVPKVPRITVLANLYVMECSFFSGGARSIGTPGPDPSGALDGSGEEGLSGAIAVLVLKLELWCVSARGARSVRRLTSSRNINDLDVSIR